MNRSILKKLKSSTFSHLGLELFRWLIIGTSFVFLLGFLFVIIQITEFQDNLQQRVPNDEAKRVLTVLSDIYRKEQESGEKHEETALQFGEMAIMLDRMRAAQTELAAFQVTEPESESAEDKPENTIQVNSSNPKQAFSNALGDLKLYSLRFSQALEESDKNLYLLSRKKELDKALAAIRQFESTGRNPSSAKRGIADDRVNFEDRLVELKEAIEATFAKVEFPARDQSLSREMNKVLELMTGISTGFSGSDVVRSRNNPPGGSHSGGGAAADSLSDMAQDIMTSLNEVEALLTTGDSKLQLANQIITRISEIQDASINLTEYKNNGQLHYAGKTLEKMDSAQVQSHFIDNQRKLVETVDNLEMLIEKNTPVVKISQNLDSVALEKRSQIANNLWQEFNGFERYSGALYPFAWLKGLIPPAGRIGIDPKSIATISYDSLVLLFVLGMGALGSLLYVTKYSLEASLHGISFRQRKARPFSWLIFRPVFGIVVALVLYLLINAVQFALGGGNGQGAISLSVYGICALVAGILSWQFIELIESKGLSWFRNMSRKDLWATGITNALRNEGWSESKLANQVGRSIEQIQRWARYEDKVTPELQDRISTALGRPREELFSEMEPQHSSSQQPLWATGLKKVAEDQGLDDETLAEMLNTENERVESWIKLHTKVPPGAQWTLVGLLKKPHEELFTSIQPHDHAWAVNLRTELLNQSRKTQWLADAIKKSAETVRQWTELQEPVPEEFWEPILDELQSERAHLFVFHPPSEQETWWATGLREALAKRYPENGSQRLAEKLDVERQQVRDWMELIEPVYSTTGTKQRLEKLLRQDNKASAAAVPIFESYYPAREMSKAEGALKSRIKNKQGISVEEMAIKLDMSKEYLQAIINEKKDTYVAPETRKMIEELLEETSGRLFKKAAVHNLR